MILSTRHRKGWWTAKLSLASGDIWLTQALPTDRSKTFAGATHETVLLAPSRMGSSADRDERRLAIDEVEIPFVNLQDALAAGGRLSDLFDRALESRFGEVWLNLEDAAGDVSREIFGAGVIRSGTAYSIPSGVIRLKSRLDHYLSENLLPTLKPDVWRFARESDLSRTIPLVIGSMPKAITRQVKAHYASLPTPSPANTSGAEMQRPQVAADALDQGYTLTISDPETHEQETADATSEVGARSGTGVTEDASTTAATATETNELETDFAIAADADALTVHVGLRNETFWPRVSGVIATDSAGSVYALRRVAQGLSTQIFGVDAEIWALANPPTGTVAIKVGTTAPTHFGFVAQSWKDAGAIPESLVKQQKASSTTNSYSTDDLGPVGDLAIDVLAKKHSAEGVTQGAGQTLLGTVASTDGTSADNVVIGAARKAFSDPITMAWSWASSRDSVLVLSVIRRKVAVFAQTVQTDFPQRLGSIDLLLEKNGSFTGPALVTVSFHADDGSGDAGDVLSEETIQIPAGAAAWYSFDVPTQLDPDEVYHIRVAANRDGSGNGAVLWHRNSAGGYASGTARQGLASGIDADSPTVWTGDITGEDFCFRLNFVSVSYSLEGDISGDEGTGTVGFDFVSASGDITIPADTWIGQPLDSESWTFEVDRSASRAVPSISPSATPVSAISQVYWQDQPIESASALDAIESPDSVVHLRRATGTDATLDAIAQMITVPAGLDKVLARVFVRIDKEGTPEDDLTFRLVKDAARLPLGEEIATVSLTPELVPTDVGDGDVELRAFAAILTRPGRYWIIGESNTLSDSAHYDWSAHSAGATTGFLPGQRVMYRDRSTSQWLQSSRKGMALKVEFVTVGSDLTSDDVASATLDVEIPSGVEITCDCDGITDDGSGTYTGTASQIIRRPERVIHWLARQGDLPVPTASIDLAGTFAASGTFYEAAGYRFDGQVADQMTQTEFMIRAAFECRSVIDWPRDELQMKVVYNGDDLQPVKMIALGEIVPDGNGVPNIQFARGDISEVVNVANARWNFRPHLGRFGRELKFTTPGSIDVYGELERDDLFGYRLIRDRAMARSVTDLWMDEKAWAKNRASLVLVANHFDLEVDDAIRLDTASVASSPNLPLDLAEAMNLVTGFGGVTGAEAFRVTSSHILPDVRQIDLGVEENSEKVLRLFPVFSESFDYGLPPIDETVFSEDFEVVT